jgi:hypothetical protein
MPANQCLRPDHHQCRSPIEPFRQKRQCHSGRCINSLRLDTTLLVHRQLATQKQNLRLQRFARPQYERPPLKQVPDKSTDDGEQVRHAGIMP